MDQRRKLFIYDRKEVGILILLGVGVALFAFTLGVHLGKQVVPPAAETVADSGSIDPVDATKSQNPNRNEIANEVKHVPEAVEETLDQNLRDEVAKTGLQVDAKKPLSFPTQTKAESKPGIGANDRTPDPASRAAPKAAPGGRYTLQVGSYPSLDEAEPMLLKLNEQGLRAQVKEVEIRGKGKWFRLFVGEFQTVSDAEKAGKTYKDESRIGEFVVVRAPGAEPHRN